MNGKEHGSTSGFLRGLISALPPIHELAEQAGIDLPEVLGRVKDTKTPEPPVVIAPVKPKNP
jgi:hypothetical protein